jgi:hypothetical protein
MFGMCALFMLVCLVCQKQFAAIIHCEQAGSHLYDDPEAKENEQFLKSKDPIGETAAGTVIAK